MDEAALAGKGNIDGKHGKSGQHGKGGKSKAKPALAFSRSGDFTVLFVAEKPAIARAIATALSRPGARYWQERSASGASVPVYCLDAPWPGRYPSALAQAQSVRLRVTSTFGHIYSVDFPQALRRWGDIDPEALFDAAIEHVLPEGSSSLPEHFACEAAESHAVVLWLDCDREGENICYEVLQHVVGRLLPHPRLHAAPVPGDLKDTDFSGDARIWRARFSSLAPTDIQAAYAVLQKPNPWEAKSVDARQVIDLKVGVAFTRLITANLRDRVRDLAPSREQGRGPLISYGPCQTPTLHFCTHRFDLIQAFRKEVSYTISVSAMPCEGTACGTEAVYLKWEPGARELAAAKPTAAMAAPAVPQVEAKPRFARETLEAWVAELRWPWRQAAAVVTSTSFEELVVQRPVACNTVNLLKAASRELAIAPQACMRAAETLYLHGLLTYPRTETTRYPASMNLKRMVVEHSKHASWGAACQRLLQAGLLEPPSGVDKGDHPPITPVKCVSEGEVRRLAGDDGVRIYELVTRRMLASISPDVLYRRHEVRLEVGHLHFRLRGNTIIDPGFSSVCPGAAKEASELQQTNVLHGASLAVAQKSRAGDQLAVQTLEVQEVVTSPPELLAEADLLGKMERHGIGTDASMAQHVSNVVDRGYVEVLEPGRRMRPTTLGCALIRGLQAIDKELVRPAVRARIESDVGEIARQRRSYEDVVSAALGSFREKYRTVHKRMPQLLEAFLRARKRQRTTDGGGETAGGSSPAGVSRQTRHKGARGTFQEGAIVEYWSQRKCYWMMAMVVRRHSTGEYDLTVKKNAAAGNLRVAEPVQVGSRVLCCIDQARDDWRAASVTAQNPDGTFDVQLGAERRSGVKLEFLRWPPASEYDHDASWRDDPWREASWGGDGLARSGSCPAASQAPHWDTW